VTAPGYPIAEQRARPPALPVTAEQLTVGAENTLLPRRVETGPKLVGGLGGILVMIVARDRRVREQLCRSGYSLTHLPRIGNHGVLFWLSREGCPEGAPAT
jgi:hypothetical protein